jgi:hypothetical protein
MDSRDNNLRDDDIETEEEIALLLDAEKRGLVRPVLGQNGRWQWYALRPCKIVDGVVVATD